MISTFACSDIAERPAPGKDEVPTDTDIDYCEVYDWYGDGVCDDFCKNIDPDCGDSCDETLDGLCDTTCPSDPDCEPQCVPDLENICDPGEQVVGGCEDPVYTSCREVEDVCLGTVLCARTDQCVAGGAPIGCPDSYAEVERCSEGANGDDGSACIVIEECGESIYCEPVNCLATPACEAGMVEVESCPVATSCQQLTSCGVTITCTQRDVCEAEPACDAGDMPISGFTECPDATCYQNHLCGATVTCIDSAMPAHTCDNRPTCPAGTRPVDECQSNACIITPEVCGQRLVCEIL